MKLKCPKCGSENLEKVWVGLELDYMCKECHWYSALSSGGPLVSEDGTPLCSGGSLGSDFFLKTSE